MQIADDSRGVALPGWRNPPGTAPGTPPGTLRAPRVLVADADPGLHATLRAHLEDAGLAVRTAADGLEASYALGRERPDLVVLDRLHPEPSSFPVLRLGKPGGGGCGSAG